MNSPRHDFHEAIRALRQLSLGALVKPCHWISTPNGDLGEEWCPDCGRAKVRNLRHKDRRNRDDYRLDGGWRTDHDGTCVCAGCGVRLDGSLTGYGAEEEVEHYLAYPPRAGDQYAALDLAEVLCALEYSSGQRAEVAAEAIALAKQFIASNNLTF